MSEEAGRPLSGLRIGRVAGVPILLTPSWFVFAAFIVVSTPAALQQSVGQRAAYVTSAAFAVLLLVSVLLHEIGHCLVARAFDLPVRSITVTLLAGLTEITEPPQTPAREYAVAVSGPMVSLLLAGIGVAAVPVFDPHTLPWRLCEAVAITNGIVAAFNLLPGLPLDGGRVLHSILWRLGGDPERATRVSAWAGRVVAVVMVPVLLIGVLPAVGLGSRSSVSLILAVLVGAFIYAGATASLKRSIVVGRLPGASVERLARPALAVPASMPLAEAVRRAHEAGARALVVVDGNGHPEGLVSEDWVRTVPVERQPWISVADGARRIEPGLLLDPALVGQDLVTVMQRTPASEYLVTGEPPRVIVTRDVGAVIEGAHVRIT